jgi:hypothetical protein
MNNLSKYRCFTFKVGDNEIEVKMYFGAKEPSSMLDSNVEYEYTYFINGIVAGSGFSEEEPEDLIETIRQEIKEETHEYTSVEDSCLVTRFDTNLYNFSIPCERNSENLYKSDLSERIASNVVRNNLINLTPEQRSTYYKAVYEERKAKEVALLQKKKDALDNDKRLEQDADSWLENLAGNDGNISDELSTHDNNSDRIKHKKKSLDNDKKLEKEADLWLDLVKDNIVKSTDDIEASVNKTLGERYD